jgi:anti-sigma B factor antagonist
MQFSIEHSDPAVILLSGNVLGGAEAMEFSRAVGELVRDGIRRVVVDLTEVPLMNSSGLGMLVGASTTLRSAGGSVAVAGANEKIQGLFKMTRLDSVLAQYATRDEAVAAYSS